MFSSSSTSTLTSVNATVAGGHKPFLVIPILGEPDLEADAGSLGGGNLERDPAEVALNSLRRATARRDVVIKVERGPSRDELEARPRGVPDMLLGVESEAPVAEALVRDRGLR